MNKEDLLAAVLASDNLPTLPPVASKLIALTANEDTSFTEIADLVSQDIALSAKILKVSNSAFYGAPQQVSSLHQAASMLGTNALGSLVLSFSFLSMGPKGVKASLITKNFGSDPLPGQWLQGCFWSRYREQIRKKYLLLECYKIWEY